jgi:hypothetical protein
MCQEMTVRSFAGEWCVLDTLWQPGFGMRMSTSMTWVYSIEMDKNTVLLQTGCISGIHLGYTRYIILHMPQSRHMPGISQVNCGIFLVYPKYIPGSYLVGIPDDASMNLMGKLSCAENDQAAAEVIRACVVTSES